MTRLLILAAISCAVSGAQTKSTIPADLASVTDMSCHTESSVVTNKTTGHAITIWRAKMEVYRAGKKQPKTVLSRRSNQAAAIKDCQLWIEMVQHERARKQ